MPYNSKPAKALPRFSGEWEFIPDTAPTGKARSIPTEEQPNFDRVVTPAGRFDTDDLWLNEGRWLPVDNQQFSEEFFSHDEHSVVYEDYSYNPNNLFTDLADPYAAEYASLHDYYTAYSNAVNPTTWGDKESEFCTHAIAWWRVLPNGQTAGANYPEPKTSVQISRYVTLHETAEALAIDKAKRNVDTSAAKVGQTAHLDDAGDTAILTFDGFVSEQIIDYTITSRYQNQFFNYYFGRDNKHHVGLMTIEYVDGKPFAICKRKGCNATLRSDSTTKEDFITRVIRHGNNHGPDWIVKREDFAYIHAENCDTNHERFASCNTNRPTLYSAMLDPHNIDACYAFVLEHMRYCADTACNCAWYESLLWDAIYGQSLNTVFDIVKEVA